MSDTIRGATKTEPKSDRERPRAGTAAEPQVAAAIPVAARFDNLTSAHLGGACPPLDPIGNQAMLRARGSAQCVALQRRQFGTAERAVNALGDLGNDGTMLRLLHVGVIRAKLAIGGAHDPEEAAANRLADHVMNGGDACCAACADGDIADKARMKPNGAAQPAARPAPPRFEAGVRDFGDGMPLSPRLKNLFEPRFGRDLSSVRLHTDRKAQNAAQSIGARAFALGGSIGFGPGQFQPETRDGQGLLAHEIAHVVMAHSGVRRVGPADEAFPTPEERRIFREAREREQRQHAAWVAAADRNYYPTIEGQSQTVAGERERLDYAMTAQRAAVIDSVANGAGWLMAALNAQGYSGPGLADVRAAWADALLTAELLKQDLTAGTVSSESRLSALDSLSAFYALLGPFSIAAEQAHRTHADTENARLRADYEARLASYNRSVEIDRMSQGPIGEPGERAARASQAIMRGSPPAEPNYLTPPPTISGGIEAAKGHVTGADSIEQWNVVTEDAKRLGNGFATLVAASLPATDQNLTGLNYLKQLDARLAEFEGQNQIAVRIPAVFYPADRMVDQRGPNGEPLSVPESIPWQFYLINTGVKSYDRPATSGGEWVLIDLTSNQRFENRQPASDLDSAMLQQGATVDPPLIMFNALNSRIRFPTGRLYFKLPSGKNYILQTTEPWSLSDWLSAIGMALTAIALVAGVIATGGAAAPAAIAFYAGIGAGVAGIGATLAGLHEKSEQGALTGADVDQAAVSIGIDLVSMVTFGFGRLVGNVAKLGITGERLILVQRAAQISKGVSLTSNVYQALTATAGFISAFRALQDQPGLTDEERSRRRAELVRRALLTGVLLTVAIRSDIKDLRAGAVINVSHVDPDGVLVPRERTHAGEAEAPHVSGEPTEPHVEAPGAGQAARAHAEVSPGVHEHAADAGSGVRIGPQTHAVGVGGRGRTHDFYFCSDLCASLRAKLGAVVEAFPPGHPEREIFQGLLSKANGATRRLRAGQITQQEADAIAKDLSDAIARHSGQSPLFAALMNTNVEDLIAHRLAIRAKIRRDYQAQISRLESQAERQAANRGRGRDPTGEPQQRSPVETDVLGGFDIQEAERASRRMQALKFDTGNFSHTHAEALVPDLPRGLSPEVTVTLPGGSTGRADRVRFIYDADGDRIGAHVFEIKPNTAQQIALGEKQAQGYVDGLRAEIEAELASKGKSIPPKGAKGPNGEELYSGQVKTYDRERMRAVLRALRANRRDYGPRVSNEDVARMQAADDEIARQIFGSVQ